MALLAPPAPPAPPPPPVTTGESERHDRHRLRAFQVSSTLVTLLATGWFCTMGVVPAIIALATAKHVLVAILMMGLGDPRRG